MKVLVVEDYLPIQKAVQVALRESGYAVDVASDGAEGHWAATTNQYDCFVLGWILPKLSGLELLSAFGVRIIRRQFSC